jgi:hypothetical protein
MGKSEPASAVAEAVILALSLAAMGRVIRAGSTVFEIEAIIHAGGHQIHNAERCSRIRPCGFHLLILPGLAFQTCQSAGREDEQDEAGK